MAINKKQECLNDLRAKILSLKIAPGTDLDESTLTESYGISRTPLREILQRLAGEGYIRIEENRGAKVASMDLSIMRTFFQTAPLIYANIARLAAENRSTTQLDQLKAIQKDFALATISNEPSNAALLNHRFHELIGEMAQNPYLIASLNRMLIDHTRLSQTFYRPASPAEKVLVTKASDQHDAMISAIEAREFMPVEEPVENWWEASWVSLLVRNVSALLVALALIFGIGGPLLKKIRADKAKLSSADQSQLASDIDQEIGRSGKPPKRPVKPVSLDMISSADGYSERAALIQNFVRQNPDHAALAVQDLLAEAQMDVETAHG